jgi:YegS/Rv2252/BmrU family lipid kinase
MTAYGSVHVILNPHAGRGRAGRAWDAFRPRLKRARIPHVVCAAGSAAEVTAFATDANSDNCSAVIVVGGDGTINDVVNGLLQSPRPPPLGIIPAGTGNDWARSLSPARLEIDALIRSLLDRRCRKIDVGRVNGRYFVNNFGWGLEGSVAREVSRLRPRVGRARYPLALLSALRNATNANALIEIDGIRHQLEVSTISVANGRSTGGGFVLCPAARLDDGLLDLFLARPLSMRDLPPGLWHLLRGTPSRWPKAILLRGSVIHLSLNRPLPAHADGNLLPAELAHATIEILPRALRVLH